MITLVFFDFIEIHIEMEYIMGLLDITQKVTSDSLTDEKRANAARSNIDILTTAYSISLSAIDKLIPLDTEDVLGFKEMDTSAIGDLIADFTADKIVSMYKTSLVGDSDGF